MKQPNLIDEIIVDCFAGGGGWSTGNNITTMREFRARVREEAI